MGRYTVHLVGGENYQAAIANLSIGDPVTLELEGDSPQAPYALRCVNMTGTTIGHIERENWLARAMIDHSTPVTARIEKIAGGLHGNPNRSVALTVLTGADAKPGSEARLETHLPESNAPLKKKAGCLKIAGIGLAGLFGISIISALLNPQSKKPDGPAESTAAPGSTPKPDQAAIKEAEERKAGFHCLSAWDGSHRELVNALKQSLREPDSFEHIETRISPVNDKGYHVLMMKYRARNGFGGMNIGSLAATVKNSDCSFEVVANESS